MSSIKRPTYSKNEVTTWAIPNYWDIIAFLLVMMLLVMFAWGAKQMSSHYELGQKLTISLSPWMLPYYALRSVMRMLIALVCSTLFTFIVGALAAKNKQAERIIIPMIDILQSVPPLGYVSFTIVSFIVLFKGSMLGPECASIFVIFTAQVWNMTLSFYQSLRTVPAELKEASAMFHLSAWQKFWRIEVPFSMSGLLWNAMMSMSGSWVFLVACEAITVAHRDIILPGLGSFIFMATQQANNIAIIEVIITMFIVIALYDQLIFRPLIAWAEKFKLDNTTDEIYPESWVLDLFQKTRFFGWLGGVLALVGDQIVNFRLMPKKKVSKSIAIKPAIVRTMIVVWNLIIAVLIIVACVIVWRFIFSSVPYHEALDVVYFGAVTALRVMLLLILSSIVWVPIGVFIGLSPKATQIVQPIAQFLAAFPANLFFSVMAFVILKFHLNVNIWVSPLMILGAQWYILFNVVAGISALPKNIQQAVSTLNIKGWLWWKRLILPGVFPYYVTGVVTAAGGAWNISIIAEAIRWGQTKLDAVGLGAYITNMTDLGDFPKIALGIVVMSLYVLIINRLLWRPLYNLAERRFTIQ